MIEVVKASAGTGKTYSLVKKINSLLAQGMLPEDILVFTFTAAARNDLKERIGNEMKYRSYNHGLDVIR